MTSNCHKYIFIDVILRSLDWQRVYLLCFYLKRQYQIYMYQENTKRPGCENVRQCIKPQNKEQYTHTKSAHETLSHYILFLIVGIGGNKNTNINFSVQCRECGSTWYLSSTSASCLMAAENFLWFCTLYGMSTDAARQIEHGVLSSRPLLCPLNAVPTCSALVAASWIRVRPDRPDNTLAPLILQLYGFILLPMPMEFSTRKNSLLGYKTESLGDDGLCELLDIWREMQRLNGCHFPHSIRQPSYCEMRRIFLQE